MSVASWRDSTGSGEGSLLHEAERAGRRPLGQDRAGAAGDAISPPHSRRELSIGHSKAPALLLLGLDPPPADLHPSPAARGPHPGLQDLGLDGADTRSRMWKSASGAGMALPRDERAATRRVAVPGAPAATTDQAPPSRGPAAPRSPGPAGSAPNATGRARHRRTARPASAGADPHLGADGRAGGIARGHGPASSAAGGGAERRWVLHLTQSFAAEMELRGRLLHEPFLLH
jgi:hypothetical protein